MNETFDIEETAETAANEVEALSPKNQRGSSEDANMLFDSSVIAKHNGETDFLLDELVPDLLAAGGDEVESTAANNTANTSALSSVSLPPHLQQSPPPSASLQVHHQDFKVAFRTYNRVIETISL
jgi:hypothetical protein